jgi:cobalt-zinc-cadmium efflux system membrane fusion protein
MDTEHDTISSPHVRRLGRFGRACLFGLLALGLIALGAAGATVALRRTEGTRTPTAPIATAPTPAPTEPAGEAEVVLSPEALARAGIKTAPVTAISAGTAVTVPGSVIANAYREVKVTPIAAGIVTKVDVELGAVVRRGAPLVTIFSAELAESQTKYMSMSTMLEADHKKLERTRKLVEIGAASRQDLEEITAVHEAHATEVEAARQRLQLLGLSAEQVRTLTSPSQVVSTIVVPAPISGVITSRSANLGQVVAMGQELLSVTDLSEVWVVGDLYEQDFKTVTVGSEAAITTPAYPGLTLHGRVSYIDPRVDPQARTAKARIAVPNSDGRLRLGMYVSVSFTTPGASAVVVPRSAVQAIGDRQVVFVPAGNEDGKFIQRQVRLGSPIGDNYSVLSGLKPGENVVTEGSFFLRAEILRNAPGG